MNGGGLWRADYGSINLRTADHVRAWRAMEVLCDGGAAPIVVPVCDKRQMPAPIVNGKPIYHYEPIPHSDGAWFSDGTGYAQPVISAHVVSDTPLRSVSLKIRIVLGSHLRGGEMFSINHRAQGWRVYKIGTVVDNDDGTVDVKFRPELRDDVTAFTEIEFDDLRCVMTLADPNVLKLTMKLRRFADPDASFVEYILPGQL